MNDLIDDGLGTQLRRLLELLDGDLEQLYRQDHPFYLPRFTPVMKALTRHSALTIKEIASQSSVSHSAASQTVAKLIKHGLLMRVADIDQRYRRVALSDDGKALLPWLESRWAATQKAADALDKSLSSPLSQIMAEAIAQLEARPFADRIRAHEDERLHP